MKKHTFFTELSYVIGLIILALGTALMERADFGMSMVVAPAYILHLKISEFLPFFSFGMAEYTLQAVIIIFMVILLRKLKLSYFFSFVTAVIYGFMLDSTMALIALIPEINFAVRIVFFTLGMLLGSFGVSLLFHTYISPEAYELFVKEVSAKFRINIHKFKTGYDIVSCIISVAMSFIFFGLWQFRGVNVGTVITAIVNGFLIGLATKFFEKKFNFKDGLKLRKFF